MHHASAAAVDFTHPLLETREVRKRAVIVVSSDKGLCGALNANLLRETAQYDRTTTVFVAAGKKGAQFLARTKRKLVAEFAYHDTPAYRDCQAIAKCVQDLFLQGEVDQVDVLFSRFINTLTQRPEVRTLLPMQDLPKPSAGGPAATPGAAAGTTPPGYLFEPSAAEVMGALLRFFLDFQIGQILLEAKASEHSARMVAMKNATDNAHQLIKDLTLEYNKMRQASITKELLEIATAQMALD
jgi:F-type H+-transporting ATPase subunit gamma